MYHVSLYKYLIWAWIFCAGAQFFVKVLEVKYKYDVTKGRKEMKVESLLYRTFQSAYPYPIHMGTIFLWIRI